MLADRLADTRVPIRPLLLAIWAHDLRELRPSLVAIATVGPDDQEGPRLVRSGGTRGVQLARYHLARQVLSLWDEADEMARARLLVAFALHQGIDPAGDDAAGRRLATGLDSCGAWQAATREILAIWTGPVPGGLAGMR